MMDFLSNHFQPWETWKLTEVGPGIQCVAIFGGCIPIREGSFCMSYLEEKQLIATIVRMNYSVELKNTLRR